MARRIVFAGGQQMRALARIYRAEVASETDEDIVFIGAEAIARDAARRAMDAADVLVSEMRDEGSILSEGMLRPGADLLRVPHLMADYLWPNAGRPHRLNRGEFIVPGGPYPADFGDAFLDRMMDGGVSEDEAVERYLAIDLASEERVDALRDARHATQLRIDQATGFAMADFIAGNFRDTALFLSRERPGLPLVRRLAAMLFRRLDADPGKAGRITQSPYPGGSLPIHPSVVQHFGLTCLAADRRSPMNDEGRFTFEEYCRRYYRFEWNEALHMAIQRASEDPRSAIPQLESALLRSPGSRRGQRVLEMAQRAVAENLGYLPQPPDLEEEAPDHSAPAIIPSVRFAKRPSAPLGNALDFTPFPGRLRGDEEAAASVRERRVPSAPPSAPAAAMFEPTPFSVFEPQPIAPQAYVELPRFGEPELAPPPAPLRDPRTPLSPHTDLIQVLPRLLPKPHGLVGVTDLPFSEMPETMPPPPLRPVLPPELPPEPPRPGILARLFGRAYE
jgi:hypothetical protein